VGKLSAMSLPTRLTQPSIPPWITEVGTYNGRLGAVWQHRSKSVSASLGCYGLG